MQVECLSLAMLACFHAIAEHISKTYLPLTTLYKNLTALGVLEDDCIDTTKNFTRDDLMKLEYKDIN